MALLESSKRWSRGRNIWDPDTSWNPRYTGNVSVKNLSNVKLIFWNSYGIPNLADNDLNVDMIIGCFCETWCETEQPNSLALPLRGFCSVWASATRDNSRGKASGGLVSVITNPWRYEVVDVSHWWSMVRILHDSWYIIVGFFYLSPLFDMVAFLNLLQPVLDDIVDRFPDDIIFLQRSDFNARVTLTDYLPREIYECAYLFEQRISRDTGTNERVPLAKGRYCKILWWICIAK